MTLFFKLLVATGAVGTAIAIPLATSSYSQDNASTNSNSSQYLDSTELNQNNLPDSSHIETSVPSRDLEVSEKDPLKNKERCKVIVSEEGTGKLEMCLRKEDETKVEFIFYQEIIASSMPIKVKELKLTYRDIVVELSEKVEYSNTRTFQLPHSFYGTSSDISVTSEDTRKTNLKFSDKDCSVEWVNPKEDNQRINWKAKCISPNN